jgi:hypothetical protein
MPQTPRWPPLGTKVHLRLLTKEAAVAASKATPSPSSRLVDALGQLEELRVTLIRINPTGIYTPGAYIRAGAFVVLAHSVIEDYLEGICLEVIDGALNAFMADGRARTAILALVHYTDSRSVPESNPGGPWGLRQGAKSCRQILFGWTKMNNGLKEKDVLRLLLPTGLKESDMTSRWLAAMSALGEMRGRVAHRGHIARAQTPIDPQDALDTVEAVAATLCRIDAKLVALRDE